MEVHLNFKTYDFTVYIYVKYNLSFMVMVHIHSSS